ncbi:hypothetical protein ANCDUO_02797 [Ancylostoma duodenale]|uniref:Uncharacterized protein n=1 Tax=Ancylostoma duodenale TaxID=51022 RepID=A0A0C2HBM1_9BILA|nr:hypothetical protein ANCDUO_02797 [Ancylostoma duodenale]
MLEEEEFFVNKKEDIEKQTEELTKDISHIRQLLHNPFEEYYANRNLVGEEEREKRRTSELSHMRMLQHRAQGMLDSEPKPKRSIFGRRQQQKKSTHQGIIMASLGSLGIHAVETGVRESSMFRASVSNVNTKLILV